MNDLERGPKKVEQKNWRSEKKKWRQSTGPSLIPSWVEKKSVSYGELK